MTLRRAFKQRQSDREVRNQAIIAAVQSGRTQADVAAEYGISQVRVSQIVTATTRPPLVWRGESPVWEGRINERPAATIRQSAGLGRCFYVVTVGVDTYSAPSLTHAKKWAQKRAWVGVSAE